MDAAVDFRGGCGNLGGQLKSFYSEAGTLSEARSDDARVMASLTYIGTRARVAVYDGPASAPMVEDVDPAPAKEYIENISSRVFDLARQRGGAIPYTVIRELAENLLHAGFAEPVISILDDGHTIRFSDQGPGIRDKERALLPGYTTATSEMKSIIRGVGSGLPIVSDFLSVSGGSLSVEDNLGGGSVVTISHGRTPSRRHMESAEFSSAVSEAPAPVRSREVSPSPVSAPPLPFERPSEEIRLSTRQKHVLALVLETGLAGPSIVSRELGVGLSTAYRDLASLEEMGLITSEGGKRALTPKGSTLLGALMNHNPGF